MATASTPLIPPASPAAPSPSPQLKGLKKVLSGRRRSSEVQTDSSRRLSIDSITLEKSPTIKSTNSSPSRDGSSKSGGSGMRKLLPGHEKRQRRKQREGELKVLAETEVRGRSVDPDPTRPAAASRSASSLLTDNSDLESPPPLVSRDSHTGYLTTSSPLIKTVSDNQVQAGSDDAIKPSTTSQDLPIINAPEHPTSLEPSPRSTPRLEPAPLLQAPGLIDKADTLRVEDTDDRRRSFGRLRGKSPARKLKEVFHKPGKSPRTSPERFSRISLDAPDMVRRERSPGLAERRLAETSEMSPPAPLRTERSTNGSLDRILPSLETSPMPPKTPPSAALTTPLTTVTPPTPTERKRDAQLTMEHEIKEGDDDANDSGITISSSGNMISHRRVRSASAATHGKSKLSLSMTAPLTPAIEEAKSSADKTAGARNFTPGGGFFSTWVSAAQNAATTLTNLTAQNRSRSGTANSDPAKPQLSEEVLKEEDNLQDSNIEQKKLAIETIGTGDLDFSHLGLENANEKPASSTRLVPTTAKQNSDLKRDEVQAKVEDLMAKRAVSAAYEKSNDVGAMTEVQDPVANARPSQTFDTTAPGGTLTPPNGSIFGDETGPVKRSNSVRSKMANRRSRGSSIATGQSTIGAMIGASTATLINPATTSKITGFTPAPKTRNRAFHQLFRSVPEDDDLIEDYSCALQKDILLAGRIYISEGHICFSSNILGWVTTLIISFEEIVSIERENTAMIIPNAIAIQTLHARHTFRSLLSREATFDLMIGIWKVNHPASFQKSTNGKQLMAEQAQQSVENTLGIDANSAQASDVSSDDGSDSDDDEDDDDSARSLTGSGASIVGDDFVDAKSVARKPSGTNGAPLSSSNGITSAPTGDAAAAAAVIAGVPAVIDFPGPAIHAPTECTDSSTHYDKVIKDEVIPAPLGKIYSLLYGPQSGVFVRKYIVEEGKCLDLALEDDKKGLNNEIKSRQYSYIKPLGGSIGPKQTKCITTETLDFFDLEKSVSVTCTTQTPDVPSGSAFSTKTRYCLSWAPGNATRLQMNCTIEWTAKSWLKGPIEKGANDGQQQYGDGLVKALKAALGRTRATTVGSKGARTRKKKRSERRNKNEKVTESTTRTSNWGVFEPLQPILEPLNLPMINGLVSMISVLILIVMLTRGSGGGLGYSGSALGRAERLGVYEELWHREESELWRWLEDRAGVSKVMLTGDMSSGGDSEAHRRQRQRQLQQRKKQLHSQDATARLRAGQWNAREMQEAVRVTKEKLDAIQQMIGEQSGPS